MGDRANIRVVQHGDASDGPAVYLYTHWAGSDLPALLQQALAKRWRWDDEQYLARIILNEMQGSDRGETGFGITSWLGDGDNRVLEVDTKTQTVGVYGTPVSWSFEEYVRLPASKLYAFTFGIDSDGEDLP